MTQDREDGFVVVDQRATPWTNRNMRSESTYASSILLRFSHILIKTWAPGEECDYSDNS